MTPEHNSATDCQEWLLCSECIRTYWMTTRSSSSWWQVHGSLWTCTLRLYLGNWRALTSPGSDKKPTLSVIIGEKWLANAISQFGLGVKNTKYVTLVHKLLHVLTKFDDLGFAKKFGLSATKEPATWASTTWLSITCF